VQTLQEQNVDARRMSKLSKTKKVLKVILSLCFLGLALIIYSFNNKLTDLDSQLLSLLDKTEKFVETNQQLRSAKFDIINPLFVIEHVNVQVTPQAPPLYVTPKNLHQGVIQDQSQGKDARPLTMAFSTKFDLQPSDSLVVQYGYESHFHDLETLNSKDMPGPFSIEEGNLIIGDVYSDYNNNPMVLIQDNRIYIFKQFINPDGTLKISIGYNPKIGFEIIDQFGLVNFSMEIVNKNYIRIVGYRFQKGQRILITPTGFEIINNKEPVEDFRKRAELRGVKRIFDHMGFGLKQM
jgi:hypothetical protein